MELISPLPIDCKENHWIESDRLFGFSFTTNQKHLSLNMFFENGEYLRRMLEPIKDQVR